MWIIAHRGAKIEAPENTLAAFDRALEYPIQGIEFDVQLSKDGIPVLFHDRTLTKINGTKDRIFEYTYGELLTFSWGGWFSESFINERVVKLEEILKSYSTQTHLMIEIKSRVMDQIEGRSRELTIRVIDLIRKHVSETFLKHIHILSFDPMVITLAAKMEPSWNYVLNLSDPLKMDFATDECMAHLHGICVKVKKLSVKFSDLVHSQKKSILTYACNISAQAKKALDCKVDVMMTDNPRWLLHKMGNVNL